MYMVYPLNRPTVEHQIPGYCPTDGYHSPAPAASTSHIPYPTSTFAAPFCICISIIALRHLVLQFLAHGAFVQLLLFLFPPFSRAFPYQVSLSLVVDLFLCCFGYSFASLSHLHPPVSDAYRRLVYFHFPGNFADAKTTRNKKLRKKKNK